MYFNPFNSGHYFECVICHGWSDDGDWGRCICLKCLESEAVDLE